ncbi:MAG TPA: hypothetical protein VFF16_09565 [Telluria sp.]|nr:hypothetical protein [Telluria sp.]
MTGRRAVLTALLAAALPLRAAPRRVRVYLLLPMAESPMDRGFRTTLEEAGLDAEFVVRETGLDPARIEAAVREARARGADLVYAGSAALARAAAGPAHGADPARHLTDIPLVCATLSDPADDGLEPRRQLLIAAGAAPLPEQLEAILAYRPFERIAVLTDASLPLAAAGAERLRAAAAARNVHLIERNLPLTLRGEPATASLPALMAVLVRQGAQLLYLGADGWLQQRRHAIVDAALEQGLPTFACDGSLLRGGHALFGLTTQAATVGRLAAQHALRIVHDGPPAAAMPVLRPRRHLCLINMPVAARLDLYPAMALLNRAETVR